MLQKAAREDSIRGFSLCKSGPAVSRLIFTNDSLLFCRANISDLNVIQNILALYEQASGQQINKDKTNIFFSKPMEEERKSKIIGFFGMTDVKEYMKYLGLLAVVGRNKKASLSYIKE